jgi:hypothetical protein
MRQYYDTEGTQHDLYKLFFEDISKDLKQAEKEKKDEINFGK